MTIFRQKDLFPSLIVNKLASVHIDFEERYRKIKYSDKTVTPMLPASVVVLLNYKQFGQNNSEYVFQLIKRSDKVSQAGDISFPGGSLNPVTDRILSNIFTTGLFPSLYDQILSASVHKNKTTVTLIRLFLVNALREAWEEIGLNPFNINFLGALPCYSLTLFTRTIFPLVCLSIKPFEFKLNQEVEKILEIPVSTFFDVSRYALLEIEIPPGKRTPACNKKYPCIVLADDQGKEEVLWGATFNVIMDFFRIISDDKLPHSSSPDIIKRVLPKNYISGNSR